MKVIQPINIYLPQLLVDRLAVSLVECPPGFNYKTIYFYYVIYYLIDKKNRFDKYEYIAINKTKLKYITTSIIDRYINYLAKYEFIISDKKYIRNVKSYWYKPNTKLFADEVKSIDIPIKSKLFNSLKKARVKNESNISKGPHFLYAMFKRFKQIDFDYEAAENWIYKNADQKKHMNNLTALNQFKNINLRRFNRNKTNNRLDTNLTNLKSELKQFIKGDYVSIDLANSQPFLLSILINFIIKPITNPINTLCHYFSYDKLATTFGSRQIQDILLIRNNQEEEVNTNLSLFIHNTQKGIFYDSFIQMFPGYIERKEVKNLMFKVLFSKNEIYKDYYKYIPYEKEKEIFSSVYPFIQKVIEILKEKSNSALAIYLQKIESYLFLDCIAKELVNAGIVPLTIHDSIIVEKHQEKKTLEIMNKVFLEQIGIIPTFTIKPLQKENPPPETQIFKDKTNVQIKRIAHNIRNTKSNKNIKQKKRSKEFQNQLALFQIH